jgi:hypothetical protein
MEQNNVLGFSMVNPYSEDFFIYAKSLINICNHPDEYVRIKKRDRKYKIGRGYHQGEIYGILSIQNDNGDDYSKISIYFGPGGQTLKLNSSGKLNAVETQIYHFPKKEFESFMIAIEAMENQNENYMYLKMNLDVGLNQKEYL